MDVLVAMGTSAAYFFSLYQMFAPGADGHLYFEAAAVIITLVMVGKHLEARAKRGAAAAIQELPALRPDKALGRLPNGEVEERPCSQLEVGDVVISRPGDQIASDGMIVRGEADVDESLITGESRSVPKGVGDPVTAGSMNVDGFLDIETTAVGEDSTLAKMITLVENAQVGKPAVQRLVDRVSAVFVPAVIGIAVVTFIGWLVAGHGFEQAIISAAATLVIACPCALGLATPTAIMTGSSAAARAGILVKDITTLEQAHTLTHVVFDKTGTLTMGHPELADPASYDPADLALARALAQGSSHPLAVALTDIDTDAIPTQYRRNTDVAIPAELDDLKEVPGHGVDATWEGQTLRLGRADWVGADPVPATATYLKVGDRTVAFRFTDSLRDGAEEAVKGLKSQGKSVVLLSGDHPAAVADIRPRGHRRLRGAGSAG